MEEKLSYGLPTCSSVYKTPVPRELGLGVYGNATICGVYPLSSGELSSFLGILLSLTMSTTSPTETLGDIAEAKGIEFFLFSFVDLFGVLRSKLVPAQAASSMQKDGAGFAGFAANFDMRFP